MRSVTKNGVTTVVNTYLIPDVRIEPKKEVSDAVTAALNEHEYAVLALETANDNDSYIAAKAAYKQTRQALLALYKG